MQICVEAAAKEDLFDHEAHRAEEERARAGLQKSQRSDRSGGRRLPRDVQVDHMW